MLVASPFDGAAQTIRGELLEETIGAPIEGAFVVLLDEEAEEVGAMLTNRVGRFVLQAPAAGRYRLRAERIGYESFLSPELDLQVGQVFDYRMTMPVLPIELAEISVEGERQCEIRRAEGERVAAVWEEARKALTAAVWTEKERNLRFSIQLWDRLLDPRNLEILEQQSEIKNGLPGYPFRALPIEDLARTGYVRRLESASATEYYAPDAETLLSDLFLDDHCFRVTEGRGDNAGLVGLEFEPVADQGDKTDVSGVLWLNERDAHLRFVEYRYVNLPAEFRGSEKLGGRLEFRMIPGGAWVVDDWYIRMPVTDVRLGAASNANSGDLRRLREKRRLVAIKEEGGAVIGIADPGGGSVDRLAHGSLVGVAFDSTRNAPLSHATISLLGTNHRTTTDETGRYSMEYVPQGDFFLTISHPRVGLLRLGSALRPVRIEAERVVTVDFVIPPARSLAPTLCPRHDGGGIAVGLVVDEASGDPVRGATVRLSNRPDRVVDQSGAETEPAGSTGEGVAFETVTDADGGFLVCEVPTGVRLYAAASVETTEGMGKSEVVRFSVAGDEIHEVLLEVILPTRSPSGR